MDALNVISLADAKDELVVDFDDRDKEIIRHINTAVSIVEVYTNVLLYQREKVYVIPSCGKLEIYDYPISLNPAGISIRDNVLSTVVYGSYGYSVLATVGYVTDVPTPLIDACLKIVTYLYENRDVYQANLPADVQLLINPYKRSATF